MRPADPLRHVVPGSVTFRSDDREPTLGELRSAGWPAPEDPGTSEDTELDGRDLIADRLCDEVEWLRHCAQWLHHLHVQGYPPAVNLRPAGDWPDTAPVMVDLPRVQAILERIAADVDELARARRVSELDASNVWYTRLFGRPRTVASATRCLGDGRARLALHRQRAKARA